MTLAGSDTINTDMDERLRFVVLLLNGETGMSVYEIEASPGLQHKKTAPEGAAVDTFVAGQGLCLLRDYRRQVFQHHTVDLLVNHANLIQRQMKPAKIDILIDRAIRVIFFEQFLTCLTIENQ